MHMKVTGLAFSRESNRFEHGIYIGKILIIQSGSIYLNCCHDLMFPLLDNLVRRMATINQSVVAESIWQVHSPLLQYLGGQVRRI